MRPWMLALFLAGCSPAAPPLTVVDRNKFLHDSILDGLVEDGADPVLIQALSEKADDHFVQKCPICEFVKGAFVNYVKSAPAGRSSFPPAIATELKSPDRMTRRAGLEKLVERYVARGFERSKMTSDQKSQMRTLLEEGKKDGMAFAKYLNFGDSCPSCSGSTKPAK
jgi:hypothetical protein